MLCIIYDELGIGSGFPETIKKNKTKNLERMFLVTGRGLHYAAAFLSPFIPLFYSICVPRNQHIIAEYHTESQLHPHLTLSSGKKPWSPGKEKWGRTGVTQQHLSETGIACLVGLVVLFLFCFICLYISLEKISYFVSIAWTNSDGLLSTMMIR